MSDKFEEVKGYYDSGRWGIQRVRDAVGRWITVEEYKQITGQDYPVEGNGAVVAEAEIAGEVVE